MPDEPVDIVLGERRSLEISLNRLRARCEKRPNARLARMIEQLDTVIAKRQRSLTSKEPPVPA
jgi:hypothetical protein